MVLAFAGSGRLQYPADRDAVNVSQGQERAWVEVNLAHLVANARTAQAAALGGRMLPMVKAEAYGLGAVPVVRALEQLDPWGYGVATVDEGAALRQAGIRRPIIVFTPARVDLLPRFREHDLRAVLDEPDAIAAWDRPFHVEIDTGMGRAGIRWDDDRVAAVRSGHLEGVFTHLHSADTSPESVEQQWTRFRAALDRLPARPPLVHAANSAGVWRLQQRLDLVRPGIFLYGGRLAGDLPEPRAVAALRARVVSVRAIPKGESVSYGAQWRATRETTAATLGIGYADGVRRSVQNRAQVLLCGRRCPVIGRVTMDMMIVEAAARVGDVATLIGGDGDQTISLDEFAGWAGTISYEVLTGLGQAPRLPRVYT